MNRGVIEIERGLSPSVIAEGLDSAQVLLKLKSWGGAELTVLLCDFPVLCNLCVVDINEVQKSLSGDLGRYWK